MCTFSIGICIGVSCISQTDKKGYHSSYFDIPQQEILKRLPATSMHLLLSCMVIRAPNQGFNRYFFWGYQHSILLFSRIFITSSLYFEEHLCKETLPEQLNLPGWFYRQRLLVLVHFRIYWAWLWKRYLYIILQWLLLVNLVMWILRVLNASEEWEVITGSCNYKKWLSAAVVIIVVFVAITTAVVVSCLKV